MPARQRTSRTYSAKHRAARKRLLPHALGTMCPCCEGRKTKHNCDGLMTDPARMDCDHSRPVVLGGGEAGDRIICLPCNRSAGATLGNQMRSRTQAKPKRRLWVI